MARVLKSGQGWRIGWNPDANRFQGLLGNDNWAIELTQSELDDFCRLAMQLADTMQSMAAELMDEEMISLEGESDRLWLEASGFPKSYSLRFILSGERKAEGCWAAAVVPELLQALQSLRVW